MWQFVRKILKRLVPCSIRLIYYNVNDKISKKNNGNKTSFETVLENLKNRGIFVKTVIDIGASDGRWSNKVMNVFSEAEYLLIEANKVHKNGLEKFKENNQKIKYIIAAAGDKTGEIYFEGSDPFGGLAMHEKPQGKYSVVKAVTVDQCVHENELSGPFLMKLDTHGFEVPIFTGAEKTLNDTNIIIVEVYNFKIAKDSLLFYEMCKYMGKNGFRCSGIINVKNRMKDNFLWEMDMVFVRDTREEFTDNEFS
ncbi:MAG: FkbM family methyltransferase [Treponema sp.]|nr:FkbM family methyltransferase [Treponema sp.]MCL2273036.1 FkbM family methyltransferase [Treponema sp.]